MLCQAQAYPVPLIRFVVRQPPSICAHVNRVPLKYSNIPQLGSDVQIRFVSFVPNPSVEPIGYKAPSLSSNAESITFKHAIGQSFGLLCQAQAFPVPVFRYDECRETYKYAR